MTIINNEEIGLLINIGITTMRVYRVFSSDNLIESYEHTYAKDPKDKNDYYDDIMSNVSKFLKTNLPIKVLVDYKFPELFSTNIELKQFIWDFYSNTKLYFNILTKQQTEKNLRNLFGGVCKDTAIINIGSRYVELLLIGKSDKESLAFQSSTFSIPISLKDVNNLRKVKQIGDIWSLKNIQQLKRGIKHLISSSLVGINAEDAIILKGELDFMSRVGYPLVVDDSLSGIGEVKSISFENYRKSNHSLLFSKDFKKELDKRSDLSDDKKKRYFGYKNGHLLLETIFESIGIKRIIPSDLLNIHGSEGYIYNVVLSGSTNNGRSSHFFEGAELVKKQFGDTVNIISPQFDSVNKCLYPITKKTIYDHFQAIENCDLLFVCNKDGHIGISTAIEIGYASAIQKTIAFWESPEDEIELKSIPQEKLEAIKLLSISRPENNIVTNYDKEK